MTPAPLYSYVRTLQVSGNFHVAAGEGVMREGRHIHLYTMETAERFNTSHSINHLSFGEPYPGMKPNPLDNTARIIDAGTVRWCWRPGMALCGFGAASID